MAGARAMIHSPDFVEGGDSTMMSAMAGGRDVDVTMHAADHMPGGSNKSLRVDQVTAKSGSKDIDRVLEHGVKSQKLSTLQQ